MTVESMDFHSERESAGNDSLQGEVTHMTSPTSRYFLVFFLKFNNENLKFGYSGLLVLQGQELCPKNCRYARAI